MTDDALVHLMSARSALLLEAYRIMPDGAEVALDNVTIAEDLKRIDCALGPKGESIFAHIADSIEEAYVELIAAIRALRESKP